MDWSIGNILWIIIGGAIIGIIARMVLPGRQPIPFWLTILAGIVGMLVGDWLAGLLGVKETAGFDWTRHGLQVLVGMIAVGGAATLNSRRTTT
ncbi:MAG TPA: GlsB/YeaQ/YmgE family stress response membrane protein [Humibacillus sp.]|nr:GlsB/YeaQ/YmgE family stress response membrane protein [Humibacillus sp.]